MYPNDDRYTFSKKWSPEIAEFNFTQVPDLLLACQGHLKITDGELLTLIHLLTYWYRTDSVIFPSITTLTKFSHKHYTTVQKRLRILEEKGFVKRKHILGTSNRYDIAPCVQKLSKHLLVCKSLPRKQGESIDKLTGLPTSFSSSKEDEVLNIQTKENIYDSGKVIIAGLPIDKASLSWMNK